jgi:hypothetical protein
LTSNPTDTAEGTEEGGDGASGLLAVAVAGALRSLLSGDHARKEEAEQAVGDCASTLCGRVSDLLARHQASTDKNAGKGSCDDGLFALGAQCGRLAALASLIDVEDFVEVGSGDIGLC